MANDSIKDAPVRHKSVSRARIFPREDPHGLDETKRSAPFLMTDVLKTLHATVFDVTSSLDPPSFARFLSFLVVLWIDTHTRTPSQHHNAATHHTHTQTHTNTLGP